MSTQGVNTASTQDALRVGRSKLCQILEISKQRLSVLIKQGRIKEGIDGLIDVEAARRDYMATLDPDRRHRYESRARLTSPASASAPAADAAPTSSRTPAKPAPAPGASEVGELLDFTFARTKKELANAKRAELEFSIKSGQYLPRDEVVAKEFAVARKLRDRILGFPARIQNLVSPEAMASITQECEALVRELAEDAARIAESTPID